MKGMIFLLLLSWMTLATAASSSNARERGASSSRQQMNIAEEIDIPQQRPLVEFDAYIPHAAPEERFYELEFGPGFDRSNMIIDNVRDSREHYQIRQSIREHLAENGAYQGNYAIDTANDRANFEAWSHLSRINKRGGGALWSTAHRRLYLNKHKDLDEAVDEWKRKKVPTLRKSQRNGVIEFLMPGKQSMNHLSHNGGTHTDSDAPDTDFYDTQSDSNSAVDHFQGNDQNHYYDDYDVDSDAGN